MKIKWIRFPAIRIPSNVAARRKIRIPLITIPLVQHTSNGAMSGGPLLLGQAGLSKLAPNSHQIFAPLLGRCSTRHRQQITRTAPMTQTMGRASPGSGRLNSCHRRSADLNYGAPARCPEEKSPVVPEVLNVIKGCLYDIEHIEMGWSISDLHALIDFRIIKINRTSSSDQPLLNTPSLSTTCRWVRRLRKTPIDTSNSNQAPLYI
jgi:hypothetical protein